MARTHQRTHAREVRFGLRGVGTGLDKLRIQRADLLIEDRYQAAALRSDHLGNVIVRFVLFDNVLRLAGLIRQLPEAAGEPLGRLERGLEFRIELVFDIGIRDRIGNSGCFAGHFRFEVDLKRGRQLQLRYAEPFFESRDDGVPDFFLLFLGRLKRARPVRQPGERIEHGKVAEPRFAKSGVELLVAIKPELGNHVPGELARLQYLYLIEDGGLVCRQAGKHLFHIDDLVLALVDHDDGRAFVERRQRQIDQSDKDENGCSGPEDRSYPEPRDLPQFQQRKLNAGGTLKTFCRRRIHLPLVALEPRLNVHPVDTLGKSARTERPTRQPQAGI